MKKRKFKIDLFLTKKPKSFFKTHTTETVRVIIINHLFLQKL